MNIIFALVAALVMVGCKPNDAHVKTVKERVDGGEIVVFSEPGTKLPNCRTAADWTGIRGTPNVEQERIVLGKQRSVGGPGVRACYRIGAKVLINDQKPSMGTVVVQSIAIARLDHLRQGDLKGRHFDSKDEFNAFTGALAKRMDNNAQGYVYIINVAYVGGSAVNEKAIKESDSKDFYEETTADGKGLDNCNAWTSMDVAVDFHQPILDQKLNSYFRLGRQNCIAQGQVIELKEKFGANFPVIAKVKVKKVKRFKVAALAAKHFELNGFDFKVLNDFILKANNEAKAEIMTVVDFELVPAVPGPLTQNCPAINITRPLTSELTVDQDSAHCAQPGNLTQVVTVNGNQTLSIPVRVKTRIDDIESSTVVLELERLDTVQGEQP